MAQLFRFAFLAVPILAQVTKRIPGNSSLTSTGCADAAGFEICQKRTVHLGGEIHCYAKYCWNRVYECEYQQHAIQFLMDHTSYTSQIPYFPAPANAPDSCSCGLGNIYLSTRDILARYDECVVNLKPQPLYKTNHKASPKICKCCRINAMISVTETICPTTDPELFGAPLIFDSQSIKTAKLSSETDTEIIDMWADCVTDTEIPWDTCVDIGFPTKAAGEEEIKYPAYNFSDPTIPKENIRSELSNLPGIITIPPAGPELILTMHQTYLSTPFFYTITAATAVNESVGLHTMPIPAGYSSPTPILQITGDFSVQTTPNPTIQKSLTPSIKTNEPITDTYTPDSTKVLHLKPMTTHNGGVRQDWNGIILAVSILLMVFTIR